jgi:hypothetical protein
MPATPEGSFRVLYFDHTIQATRALAEEASRLGIRRPFLESLKVIQTKLKQEPLTWGDPLFRYQHLGLVMRHGIHSLIHVYYAVDEGNHLVYVRDLLPLPWRWLETT